MRRFVCILALGMVSSFAGRAGAQTSTPARAFPPRVFALKAGDIPGWVVAKVNVSRRESNWRAWHDSRPWQMYLYQGQWGPLGRITGWYQRLLLYSGPADAVTTVLVSEFPNASAAARTYAIVTKGIRVNMTPQLIPFSAGSRAGEWAPSRGIASGPQGCAGLFGTFVDYIQFGPMLAEISSHVNQSTCGQLPNPGQSIAHRLVHLTRAALIPKVSSSTVVDGLRLTLSIPSRVYPLDALASVTIDVTNVTDSPISLLASPEGTLAHAIDIREFDSSGKIVPMPAAFEVYDVAVPPGPPIPVGIQPHQTMTLQLTIILWAPQVRVEAQMWCVQGMTTPCGDIASAPVTVQLMAPDPPRIELLDSGPQPTALVRPGPGFHGHLLSRSEVECTLAGGRTVRNQAPINAESGHTWGRTTSILFTPPSCSPEFSPSNAGPAILSAWRLIAGWPGHSVGALDYRAP